MSGLGSCSLTVSCPTGHAPRCAPHLRGFWGSWAPSFTVLMRAPSSDAAVPRFPEGENPAAFPAWYEKKWLIFCAKVGFLWAYHENAADVPACVPPLPAESAAGGDLRGRSRRPASAASPSATPDPAAAAYANFVDNYGPDVKTPGAFRRQNIQLIAALREALEHHDRLAALATGDVYSAALLKIMTAVRGSVATFVRDKRQEVVSYVARCSTMDDLSVALVKIAEIRNVLRGIPIQGSVKRTDYDDFEIVEFVCAQFKVAEKCGSFYEDYRRDSEDPRWDSLEHLTAFVVNTANTRRELGEASPNSAFAAAPGPSALCGA